MSSKLKGRTGAADRGMVSTAPAGRRSRGWRVLWRLLHEDRGQDLVEYALLTAIVGIAGILALESVSGKMETAYRGWNDAVQAAWEPCPPGGCT
jgi:Flp pilus assembly pilin Flp